MFNKGVLSIGIAALLFFAAAPSSTNYTLKAYDVGSGGGAGSSTNFGLQAQTGEQSQSGLSSTNYKVNSGIEVLQQANVPQTPTFANPSNEYNRLKLTLNPSTDPTDTRYEVAISTDSFTTTNFIQTDNTIGITDTAAQYQTYTAWGGASGVWITGLAMNTTYQVKVRALQGAFTGSSYGPVASATTVAPSLTFSVATSASSVPPFSVGFSGLTAGTIINGGATIDIGLSTNAVNGGAVYVKSSGALTSSAAGSSITSTTADLSLVQTGYGAVVSSVSQSSGGPFSAVAPFNGSGSNVGVLATSLQQILSTSVAVTSGTASVTLKAKADATTPAATDYTDTMSFIASMLY